MSDIDRIDDARIDALAAEYRKLAGGRDVSALGMTFERFVRVREMHDSDVLDRAIYIKPGALRRVLTFARIGRA